jgi:hypothetical protein
MKHPLIKKSIPHLIAIGTFLIIALLYNAPALKNKVLQQHDVRQWEGAFQDSKNYAEKNGGNYPLWNKNMFGGMPNFQIGGTGTVVNPATYIHNILTLGLPKPANFFFLACICFYIMAMCFGIKPVVGIITSIAYAYATYNPIIIAAGHDTKMLAISYMPTILGGVYLILQKRYWLGGVLTAVFTSLIIGVNHLQIFYYLAFALGFMAIFYAIKFIKEKAFLHLAKSAAIAVGAIVLGILCNAQLLMSTFEYQKATQRGGAGELSDTTKTSQSKTGLPKDYAMSYSMYKSEPLVMFVPKLFGGSSAAEYDMETSKSVEAYQSGNQQIAKQLQQNRMLPNLSPYWGGIGGTSGPPYAGAILVVLAILGWFLVDKQHRWWTLASLLIIWAISAGSYFDSFNGFMYDNFIFFNKFRAPSMALVIAQLILSLMAALGLNALFNFEDKKLLQTKLKYAAITVGVLLVICFAVYASSSFKSVDDLAKIEAVKKVNNIAATDYVNDIVKGERADRKSLALSSIMRTLGFSVLALLALFAIARNYLKPLVAAIILGVLMFADVATINSKYYSEDNYMDKEENESNFVLTDYDKKILEDKSDFRVFDQSGGFSDATSAYHFRSISGYHSAKLKVFQDLMERHLYNGNQAAFDMLNTKYYLQKDEKGKTLNVQQNQNALGSAWFVKAVQFVKDANAEIDALTNFNPKDTAIVQERFKTSIPFAIETDTTAKINLEKNNNDIVTYTASNSKNAFAVFSEIYYDAGWSAFVDGKLTPIVKTNYALRGLALAPGTHKIEFKFLPEGYKKGTQYSRIASMIILAMLLGLAYLIFKEIKNAQNK